MRFTKISKNRIISFEPVGKRLTLTSVHEHFGGQHSSFSAFELSSNCQISQELKIYVVPKEAVWSFLVGLSAAYHY